MKKIEKIVIQHIPDNDADLSHLGEFSFTAAAGAILHVERSGNSRNTVPFFNPANPEYGEQDYKRIMAYERGEWSMLGIKAIAEIKTSDDGKTWSINRVTSAGLWGIESDSDESYFEEVADEERHELASILQNLGFTAKEIKAAPVSREDK